MPRVTRDVRHGVADAFEQLVADVLRRQLAQGREADRRGPVARSEAAHQILDHARECEELLVGLVVHEATVTGSRA